MFKLAKKAFRRVARGAVDWIFEREKTRRAGVSRIEGTERPQTGPRGEKSAGAEVMPAGAEAGTQVQERRGAARDERSFEQRRRGGPFTGGAPSKIHGPRHTGGGHRRGRNMGDTEEEDAVYGDLPLFDYDQLSVPEIEDRVGQLDDVDVRELLRYEIANKHRQNVIEALNRRLAA